MTKTVTVELKNSWFAPTTAWAKSPLQVMSGRRFKKGIYTWPESVLPYLPTSAKVLDKDLEEIENPFDGEGFGGFRADRDPLSDVEDMSAAEAKAFEQIERKAAEADKINKKSQEEILAERRANLKKANEARERKAAEKAKAEKEKAAKAVDEIEF